MSKTKYKSQYGFFGVGKSEFKIGIEGLPKRSGKIRAGRLKRTTLGTLSKARLSRRIGYYEKLINALFSELDTLQFELGETGFRLELWATLNALLNRTKNRLEAANYYLSKKL